jgi:4-hydroxybenzoate polyprenyltransferase
MSQVAAKPPAWWVYLVLGMATTAMIAGVYFGGRGQLPLAMTGTGLFVVLGGLGFDLARRRSA